MIKLIGVFIVIIGFALNLNPIAIIIVSAIVTAFTGGIGAVGLLSTLGNAFVNNRSMCIFIAVMFITGTLERNGLKAAATKLISKEDSVILWAHALLCFSVAAKEQWMQKKSRFRVMCYALMRRYGPATMRILLYK